MLTLRRRLASWALALLCCQVAAVFAAPLVSCCPARPASVESDPDCCPAGTHPPGQCPRHAQKKPGTCRLRCDAPHGAELLIAAIGILPAPAPSAHRPAAGDLVSPVEPAALLRVSVPHSPPPRLS